MVPWGRQLGSPGRAGPWWGRGSFGRWITASEPLTWEAGLQMLFEAAGFHLPLSASLPPVLPLGQG